MTIIAAALCSLANGAQAPSSSDADQFVARMLAFDKNHDGRLTRKELTDPRLHRVFERADANHDGVVTERELRDLYRTESTGFVQRHGLPETPDDHGEPPIGQVIPEDLQQNLGLTGEQRDKLLSLQRDVDLRLKSLLTEKQQNRLKNFKVPGGANSFRSAPDAPSHKSQ